MSRSDALRDRIARDSRLLVAPESIVVRHEIETADGWVVAAEFDGYGPVHSSILKRRTRHYQGLYAMQAKEDGWTVREDSVGGAGAATKRSRVWSRYGGFGQVLGGWVSEPRGVRIRITDWDVERRARPGAGLPFARDGLRRPRCV